MELALFLVDGPLSQSRSHSHQARLLFTTSLTQPARTLSRSRGKRGLSASPSEFVCVMLILPFTDSAGLQHTSESKTNTAVYIPLNDLAVPVRFLRARARDPTVACEHDPTAHFSPGPEAGRQIRLRIRRLASTSPIPVLGFRLLWVKVWKNPVVT